MQALLQAVLDGGADQALDLSDIASQAAAEFSPWSNVVGD